MVTWVNVVSLVFSNSTKGHTVFEVCTYLLAFHNNVGGNIQESQDSKGSFFEATVGRQDAHQSELLFLPFALSLSSTSVCRVLETAGVKAETRVPSASVQRGR